MDIIVSSRVQRVLASSLRHASRRYRKDTGNCPVPTAAHVVPLLSPKHCGVNVGCSFGVHRGLPLSGRSTGRPAGERGEEPWGDIPAGRVAGPPGSPFVAGRTGRRRVRGRRVLSERCVGAIDALPLCISSFALWSLPSPLTPLPETSLASKSVPRRQPPRTGPPPRAPCASSSTPSRFPGAG